MRNRDFVQTGSRFLLLLSQFIVLVICISYIEYFYFQNIYPDNNAKNNFLQAECFVIGKKLSTKGHVIIKYRADFLISYEINNVRYNRWVSGNGLDISFTSNLEEQQAYLNQFNAGGSYPCWYDPENPQVAILILRHNWLSTLPLMVPSIIGIITLYYFLKNLFVLFGSVKEIMKEKNERKKR